MNIDITSLRVERSSDTHIRIAMKKATGKYVEYETFFCLNKEEYEYARACMLGTAKVYPYFDDATYLLKFYPSGMRVAYTDRNEMDYFTFPANELPKYIDVLFDAELEHNGDNPKYDLTYALEQWQVEYGPNIQVNIEPEVKERMLTDIVHPLLKEPAKNLIDDLIQWAGQYSNGNLISVNIVFDNSWDVKQHPEIPASYYWWLFDEERKALIFNGGYIAHHYEQRDGMTLYQYSMHT